MKVHTGITTITPSYLAGSRSGQPSPETPTDLFRPSSEDSGSESKFLKAAWSGTKGALKFGAIGGMALGGLGAVGSYMTGNGSFRLWGLAIGAALGGISGAVIGASEVMDRPQ